MRMTMRTVATALALTLAAGACGWLPSDTNSEQAKKLAAANREHHRQAMLAVLDDRSKPASERLGAARSLVHVFPDSPEALRAKNMIPALKEAIVREQEVKKKTLVAEMDDEAKPALQRIDAANALAGSFSSAAEAERAKRMLPVLRDAAIREAMGGRWVYLHDEDKMTGQVTSTAEISSTNQVSLGFPYAGEQRASLVLRKHPRHGSDVIFSIERGQLLCRSFSGCPVRLRFDSDKPLTLTGTEPADRSTEMIFLPGYKSVATRLASSKKLLVEVGIYQNGNHVFEFDVAGFEPDKISGSSKKP